MPHEFSPKYWENKYNQCKRSSIISSAIVAIAAIAYVHSKDESNQQKNVKHDFICNFNHQVLEHYTDACINFPNSLIKKEFVKSPN